MGFYSNLIIPYCIDFSMSGDNLREYRRELLANVSGEILEIGFSMGLNLPHYLENVAKIITIEPNPGMQKLARRAYNILKLCYTTKILVTIQNVRTQSKTSLGIIVKKCRLN